MNTEKLISKYLDGNLTNEEDAILRFAINNDLKAKNAFEQSVHIFSIMKKDAQDIRVPQKLLSNTEDIIMMKYINIANQNIKSVPVKRNYKFAYNLIAASVCFLFLNLFFIADLEYNPNSINSEKTSSIKYNSIEFSNDLLFNSDIINSNQKKKVDNKEILIVNKNEILKESTENISTRSNEEALAERNNTIGENEEFTLEFKNPNTLLKSIEISKLTTDFIENPKQIDLTNLKLIEEAKINENYQLNDEILNELSNNNIQQTNLMNIKDFNFSSKVININSFFGTDVIRSGISDDQKAIVSNFSQSVTYSITNTHSVGVEFGYSNYTFNENLAPNETQPQKIKQTDEAILKVNELSPLPINFNYSSLSFDNNKQIYWGAAFYELLMLDNDIISLKSRIGAGVTEEGPLSYGRIFSCYQLFNGFNITIGTEGRVFFSRFPEITQSSKELKAIFSIIYGFQINL